MTDTSDLREELTSYTQYNPDDVDGSIMENLARYALGLLDRLDAAEAAMGSNSDPLMNIAQTGNVVALRIEVCELRKALGLEAK